MGVPALVYVGLLLVAIAAVAMVNVAKYGWKSRKWTWIFTIAGIASMGTLMILVLIAT
jgi:hypothetical protein